MNRTLIIRILAAVIFLALIVASGLYAYDRGYFFSINTIFDPGAPTPDVSSLPENAGEATSVPQAGEPTTSPSEGVQATVEPGDGIPESQWQGSERVTVLVMGLDLRDWEAGESAPRTDTMMLLTIDPLSKTAGMLSIPRDLFVEIPGFGFDRINTAYRSGEVYQLPGGGAALAVETVEKLVGVHIDYFGQVDFNVFVRMIDEIGGIKLDIEEPIKVDLIGPEPPKVIQPGRYTFPGDVALAYARARGTPGGDFDRSKRQQQVIFAIRDRVLSLNLIPILLTKSTALYTELSEGVKTNMSLEAAIDLGLLAADIPPENIRKGTIGESEINFYTTPDGDQVLKPLPDQVRQVRDYVFGTAELSSPLAEMTPEARVAAEGAVVALANGTFRDGLAADTAGFLSQHGFSFQEENIFSADQAYGATQIIDYTGNPYTVQQLVDLFNLPDIRILLRYDPTSSIDVLVNLGNDWAAGFNPH